MEMDDYDNEQLMAIIDDNSDFIHNCIITLFDRAVDDGRWLPISLLKKVPRGSLYEDAFIIISCNNEHIKDPELQESDRPVPTYNNNCKVHAYAIGYVSSSNELGYSKTKINIFGNPLPNSRVTSFKFITER